jgi:hypothetical protein
MGRTLAAALTLAMLAGAAPAAAVSHDLVDAAPTAESCETVDAMPAIAVNYHSKRSGHPLRVLAYIVHPIGVILDTLIFRPAHWIGSHEPIKTLVGQKN